MRGIRCHITGAGHRGCAASATPPFTGRGCSHTLPARVFVITAALVVLGRGYATFLVDRCSRKQGPCLAFPHVGNDTWQIPRTSDGSPLHENPVRRSVLCYPLVASSKSSQDCCPYSRMSDKKRRVLRNTPLQAPALSGQITPRIVQAPRRSAVRLPTSPQKRRGFVASRCDLMPQNFPRISRNVPDL